MTDVSMYISAASPAHERVQARLHFIFGLAVRDDRRAGLHRQGGAPHRASPCVHPRQGTRRASLGREPPVLLPGDITNHR